MSSRLSGPDWSHPPLPFLETALRHLPPPWTPSCTSLHPPPLPSAHLSFNRKALKVVDLKDILAKAGVAIGKANKPDLIAKILASSEAVAVYNKNYGGPSADSVQSASAASTGVQEQLAAVCSFPSPLFVCSTVPSRRVQPQPPKASAPTSTSQSPKATTASAPSSKSVSRAAPEPDIATASPTSSSQPSAAADESKKTPEDEEAERRKARAARFGIPLVEPKAAPAQKNGKAAANGKVAKTGVPAEDLGKLAARAARFGVQAPSAQATATTKTNGKKRPIPPEPVDEEELARRKKRAERFGMPVVGV
ncbi:hypothetical protein C8Q74DRAFT_718528 [Fomes fomentarius]|nr:hypothetical protein C8Q74DRAFT_718528 [Fomes fomentarius]